MRVTPPMTRALPLTIAALILAVAPGCASNKENVIADEQSGEIDFKTKSQTYDGNSMSEEMLEQDAREVRDEQERAPEREPESGPQSSNAPLSVREDGRPSWWFSAPRARGSDLSVCAEALGPDMRLTREAAIDAGRTRLRADLDLPTGDPLPDVEVVRVWVWPLPNTQAGSNRYAGYVLMTAALDQ